MLGVSGLFASLITQAPAGGTTTVLNGYYYPNYGEVDPGSIVNNGLTISSSGYAYLSDLGYCFNSGTNTCWSDLGGAFDASGYTAITIALGGLYSSVGGFMNYTTSFGGADATIAALDSEGDVLESYDLTTYAGAAINATGVDSGAFRGISTGVDDIAYFQISGDHIGINSVTYASAAPEPASAGLVVLALGAAGASFLRRRRQTR
jgi:hypothetical protein